MSKSIDSLATFYPYYLSQHQNGACRALHLIGTTLVTLVFWFGVLTSNLSIWLALPVLGYGPAWLGHYVFEKNKPATFGHPGMSLICDWIMAKDMLIGRVPLFGPLPSALVRTAQPTHAPPQ